MVRLLILCLLSFGAFAGPLDETRCCVAEIKRDAGGKIIRRADVLRAFRDLYPCPATGQTRGACPGWALNHTIPLACGGFDSVANLSWAPNVLKSGPGYLPIDRWERRIYCGSGEIVPMPKSGRLEIK
jgi:hypothetical protein